MTVVTLAPDSTSSNTGTVIGAASAHAALADSSDSTYVVYGGVQESVLGVADLSLPSGGVVKSVAAVVRCKSGYWSNLRTLLGIGSTPEAGTFVNWTTFVDVTPAQTSGVVSDADVDAATVKVRSVGGEDDLFVSKLYLSVVYVVEPVSTITAPTGTLTTANRPSIAWTNSLDADGGAQAYYLVRLYDATTHGAFGSVDPDMTTPYTESGVVAGAGLSWTPGDPLPNDAYRAYVAVAQVVNGVPHWSAWDSQDFTIDIPGPGVAGSLGEPGTPDTTTLTATGDSTNARVALEISEGASGDGDYFEVEYSDDAGSTWETLRTIEGSSKVLQPSVVDISTFVSADETSATHVVDLPSDIREDDILIAFAAMGANVSFVWPSGWTEIKDEAGDSSNVRAGCAWRRVDSPGNIGSTFTVTTSAAAGGAIQVLSVRGASTSDVPEASTGVSGAAANGGDPDSLSPSWGSSNAIWIAALAIADGVSVTAQPSSYHRFTSSAWVDVDGAGIAVAARRRAIATEDPGAFTHGAGSFRAWTIAVKAEAGTKTTYDYEAANGASRSYRARAVADFGGVSKVGNWSSVASGSWTSPDWWFRDYNDSTKNLRVNLRSYPGAQQQANVGLIRPLGAKYAIAITDVRGPTTGTITVRADSLAERNALLTLLDQPGPKLIQGPPTAEIPERWVVFGNLTSQRLVDGAVLAYSDETLEWTEVDRPAV